VKYWYALHTRPNKEGLVARLLETRQIENYLPRVVDTRAKRRGPLPFFPGYLFTRVDLAQSGLGIIKWLPGVRGVVQANDEPVPVSEAVILHIRSRLEELEALGGLGAVSFRNGDRVTVVRGPFAGYDGLFDYHLSGQHRVRILLRLIAAQRAVPLELNLADLRRSTA